MANFSVRKLLSAYLMLRHCFLCLVIRSNQFLMWARKAGMRMKDVMFPSLKQYIREHPPWLAGCDPFFNATISVRNLE